MTDHKSLVAYFSATGNTKIVADKLADAIGADIFEIKPKKPYTAADLDWNDPASRSSVEMKDREHRPELVDEDFEIEPYSTVFIGFPIWWYVAPNVIISFVDSYDFQGKKVIFFATSGGSGFGDTLKELKPFISSYAEVFEGKVFKPSVSEDELKAWAEQYLQ